MSVQLPIVNRIIPIIEDTSGYVVLPKQYARSEEEAADPKAQFATGFLKVTPAHDNNDYQLGELYKDQIAANSSGQVLINILSPDAKLSDQHGWQDTGDAKRFLGLQVMQTHDAIAAPSEARRTIVDALKQHKTSADGQPILESIRKYTQTLKFSDRSKAVIEPYLSDQWFMRVTDDRLAGSANRALVTDQSSVSGGAGVSPASVSPASGGAGVSPASESPASGGAGVPPASAFPASGGAGVSPASSKRSPDQGLGREFPVTDQLQVSLRRLPHFQRGGSTYFVTFRTLKTELSHAERQLVLDACLHFHNERAYVSAAVIMPDHVHLLLTPFPKSDTEWYGLGELMHSIKSFTSHKIQKARGSSGPLWQDEHFDRIIRSDEDFAEKFGYIKNNPASAGLVAPNEDYPFFVWNQGRFNHPLEDERGGGRDARPTQQKTTVSPTDHQLRFHPARYAKTYEQWHENIRDWCISRQLWWGHRIPVWSKVVNITSDTKRALVEWGDLHFLDAGKDIPGWMTGDNVEQSSGVAMFQHIATGKWFAWDAGRQGPGFGVFAWLTKELEGSYRVFVCSRDTGLEKMVEDLGYERDPDVLDTWFSSALWPLSTLGWPDPAQSPQTKDLLEAFNPTSVLSTAREIITLWVSRMVMMNRYLLPPSQREGPGVGDQSPASSKPHASFEHDTRGLPTPNPLPLGGGQGPVPFHNVFIHAVVQDGDGKRMSKSAGNGVDPLDIIDSHGADAMRFTLCQMTTSTQDVRLPVKLLCPHCKNVFAADPKLSLTQHEKGIIDQKCPKCSKPMCTSLGVNNNVIQPTDDKPEAANTSEKFDLGRNLCNKLWNASRFTLSIFERIQAARDVSGSPASTSSLRHSGGGVTSSLSLPDRWMLSRLATATRDATRALENFEFSDYAETIYKLLWWDFCDWYLEAIKPTVDKSPDQQAVLAHALETILRLLHPIAPFITESIYEHVRQLRTTPILGVTLAPPLKDHLLCTAGWPQLSESLIDPAAEAQFEELRELINQIRNVRSEHQVLPKRKITLHAPQAIIAKLTASPGMVETLAGLDKVEPLPSGASGGAGVPPASAPGGAGVPPASASGSASIPFRALGVELALSNLADAKTGVDAAAEIDRLKKQLETLTKSETALAGRLNNPGYADKAPLKLVEESKAQLAKIRAEIQATTTRLTELGAP